MSNDIERKRFDLWYNNHFDMELITGPDDVEVAWEIWQAALDQGGQGAEPVGYIEQDEFDALKDGCFGASIRAENDKPNCIPLYTQPQPAVPEGWKSKPKKPGYYLVRGYDSDRTEALVQIAIDEETGETVCNLHDINSDPVSRFSNLLNELSDQFEWLELSTPATPQADDARIDHQCELCGHKWSSNDLMDDCVMCTKPAEQEGEGDE